MADDVAIAVSADGRAARAAPERRPSARRMRALVAKLGEKAIWAKYANLRSNRSSIENARARPGIRISGTKADQFVIS